MAEAVPFTIGTKVNCAGEPCGRLLRVVVNPVSRVMTHLVVEPEHRLGLARLVPIDLAALDPHEIRLSCTPAEFERLDSAEETQFVPGTRGYAAYGPEQVLSWPYYSLGSPAMAAAEMGQVSQTITYDTVPLGEVSVRRGERVQATDGAIGHVHGLVIDPGSDHVTHVLLQEGHLWGRKQVAIPIGAVTSVEDGIALSLSKRQVQDLPPVTVAALAVTFKLEEFIAGQRNPPRLGG